MNKAILDRDSEQVLIDILAYENGIPEVKVIRPLKVQAVSVDKECTRQQSKET